MISPLHLVRCFNLASLLLFVCSCNDDDEDDDDNDKDDNGDVRLNCTVSELVSELAELLLSLSSNPLVDTNSIKG